MVTLSSLRCGRPDQPPLAPDRDHADYNVANNVCLQYLRRRQNVADGGAPVDVRLSQEALNVGSGHNPPPTL